jgi:Sulfotransferase family
VPSAADVKAKAQSTAKRAGKQVVRWYGMATAQQRPLPDFLIIGAKRGGTTSLYYSLLRHPQIAPMFPSAERFPMTHDQKGVHYFDIEYPRGERWYRAHFPTARARAKRAREVDAPVVVGEGSPYHLYHPLAPQRAAALLPAPKFIVILRDPVQRAYSHFREQSRNGVEKLTFEEAIAAEPDRTRGETERILREPGYHSFPHEQQSYISQSEYVYGLERWFAHFDRDRFVICRSEDFYDDPQRVYREVLTHIGVEPLSLADDSAWNAAPNPGYDTATRDMLRERLRPSVDALEALLDRRFNWWET